MTTNTREAEIELFFLSIINRDLDGLIMRLVSWDKDKPAGERAFFMVERVSADRGNP